MDVVEKARRLRQKIEELAGTMTDAEAIEYPELYPEWMGDGVVYKAGTRVQYDGVLYSILQNHISQADWSPDKAASLFAKVLAEDGKILPWEQPDSTNAYQIGDKVYFDGKVYESVIANNVWSPSDYPAGWKEVVA